MSNAEIDPCPLCHKPHYVEDCPHHNCTGDNCYCIGGDENLDRDIGMQDAWEAFCLNRAAPLGDD